MMSRPTPLRVSYLCLQPTVEGQGSHAHVWGLVGGLERRGWVVTVHQPPGHISTRGLWGRILPFIATQLAFIRGTRKADVLYIRMHPSAVLAVLWNAALGRMGRRRRLVVEVNGPDDDWVTAWPLVGHVRWLLRWLLRQVLRGADAVVVVTSGLGEWAQQLADRPDLDVAVIPNGVDTTVFHPDAREVPPRLPRRYAVFVGELAPWQGLDDVLAAFEHDDWPADLDLVIAGDGAEAATVHRAAAAAPRRGGRQVHELGRVPYALVPGLLAASVVALVPSRGRAGTGVAPLKLFEAMACGVPVVAADVPDTNRYAPGPLVQCGDVAGWAAAVEKVVSESGGPGSPVTDHSWDQRAAATDSMLR